MGHRARKLGDVKDGIVAKTVLAVWFKCDHPFTRPFCHVYPSIGVRERDRAAETGGALLEGGVAQFGQKLAVAILVAGSWASVTRRIDARRAVERVHLEA